MKEVLEKHQILEVDTDRAQSQAFHEDIALFHSACGLWLGGAD